ncbi:MAG TPA: MauE/DoxX family redox-associated membrane protein [Acidimicrobiales bacterium]|nr:MauE/DoxX family redox-associated membrane protein [Acidimicrobiales bacterium]
MAALLGAAGLLLVAAGAAKVADPSRTAGALAALGWPSAPALVRPGAPAETLLGAAALVVGGRILALLVAASYLGFALFVMTALRAKTPIGTCGCFGRADTPPKPVHVTVDALLATGAVAAAATNAPPLLDAARWTWPLAAIVALAAYGFLAKP